MGTDLAWLAGHDNTDKAAAELLDKIRMVVAAAQRRCALQSKRGQLQPGDPSLSARLQCLHQLGCQIQSHPVVQKGPGFFSREA